MHLHIGSQLSELEATLEALQRLLALIQPYPQINTINLGGGFPTAYRYERDAAIN